MATKLEPRGDIEAALGAQFRDVRRRQKVWLKELSRSLGCSVNSIRWHEAGARSMRVEMLVRAAQVIGVHPRELIPEGIDYELPDDRSVATNTRTR